MYVNMLLYRALNKIILTKKYFSRIFNVLVHNRIVTLILEYSVNAVNLHEVRFRL